MQTFCFHLSNTWLLAGDKSSEDSTPHLYKTHKQQGGWGERVARNPTKKVFRELYDQWKGKGLEGL